MLLHELMKIYTVEISQWKTSGSVEPLSITNKQIKTFDYRVLIYIREQRIIWLLNSISLLNYIITASLIFHPDKLNILLFLYNCYPATFFFFQSKNPVAMKILLILSMKLYLIICELSSTFVHINVSLLTHKVGIPSSHTLREISISSCLLHSTNVPHNTMSLFHHNVSKHKGQTKKNLE